MNKTCNNCKFRSNGVCGCPRLVDVDDDQVTVGIITGEVTPDHTCECWEGQPLPEYCVGCLWNKNETCTQPGCAEEIGDPVTGYHCGGFDAVTEG